MVSIQPATVDEIKARSLDWIAARTVAMCAIASPDAYPVQHGTGILLRIADAAFLVSAAHVLAAAPERTLLIGGGPTNLKLIPLLDLVINRTTGQDSDGFDFGFVRLPRGIESGLVERRYQFVHLWELDLVASAPEGAYAVYGFPCEFVSVDGPGNHVQFTPMHYMTDIFKGELVAARPGVTIALNHPPRGFRNAKGELMPYLKGVSGSGIWRMYGPGYSIRTWREDAIRLVGIEHRTLGEKAVAGVLFRHVLDSILTEHPELRSAANLYYR
jgi:hypothetical protein